MLFMCGACASLLIANGANAGEGISISVSPHTLVLSLDRGLVTVHSNIPFGTVIGDSLELNGIEPDFIKADSRGELVAKFDCDAVKALVEPGQENLVLTLSGELANDTYFEASDTISVKE